ncbi:hypothetical protein ON010_g4714 [Phytophthora cinnamomi]|nr:hypothetical protein ON010_g4714 [Phytophthora cinnamomi]
MLTLTWFPPENVGGQDIWITGYNVSIRVGSSIKSLITRDNATELPYGGLNVLTNYTFSVSAINPIGLGPGSPSVTFATTNYTTPVAPAQIALRNRTGGLITVDISVPADTGGTAITGYIVYTAGTDGDYQVGKKKIGAGMVYNGTGQPSTVTPISVDKPDTNYSFRAQGLSITVFRLAANTIYDMVAVSVLENDTSRLTGGTINISDSTIVLNDNVSSELLASGNFEFDVSSGFIFEIDQGQAQSNGTITYLPSLSTDDGETESTDLESGDEYDVFVRGAFSEVSNFTTTSPTKPGVPPAPKQSDDYDTTGGALYIGIFWPDDTGGVVITGYEFYLDNQTVEGSLLSLNHDNVNMFDFTATVEIGGLTPNTRYSFYYVLTNDASACGNDTEDAPEQYPFSTVNASIPDPVPVIQSIGATGGGIHVQLTPPIDRGGDQELYYHVYFSESHPNNWKLGYNGTDVSYWQTNLQKETDYYFKATCRNDIGSSVDSNTFKLQTTLISPPGPPSGLQFINATGGTVCFSWKSPEDDGGSAITSYSVHGQDAAGDPELVKETISSEIVFGGLLADRLYNFQVFAENNLGTGSDPGTVSFSTTVATLPSLPADPVVEQMSGGAVVFSIQVPQDTGGVSVDALVWTVYANGVQVPPDAVRRLQSLPAVVTASTTRRLTSRRLAADGGTTIYLQAGTLLPSTSYSFTVQVANSVGASPITNGAENTTSVATVPGAPDPPTVTYITGGAMELTWTDPVDSDYTATLVAYNPVGASPPSAITTFTTKVMSLPQAPQGVHIAEVSNTTVTIDWEPCIDFGGGYVETYQVDIVQTLDTSVVFTGSVPVEQLNYSRAVTGDNQLGEASKIIFFRTPQFANQPRPPSVGCHSRTIANVFWEAEDDATNYLLYRDGQFLHDNGEDITFEDSITLGMTYSYQVRVKRLDGSISDLSEATQFFASVPISSSFDCDGTEGYIHWHDYHNSDHEIWTIIPQNQTGIVITADMFWLECNHDSLTINVTENGEMKQLWKGGCHREGEFMVSTASGVDAVIIAFASDQSVTYDGMALHYESVDAPDAVESVNVPCPVTPSGLCSLNGGCRMGACSCFSGYVGESCTNAVICPEDMSTCTLSTCDPVCFQSQSDVIAVSVNGDDTQGTGQLMDTSSTNGTDPKAVQSLKRALELVTSRQTILLYPGVFVGAGNCDVSIFISKILIRGLRGQTVTTIDCQNLRRGLIMSAVSIRLVGFTLRNANGNLNGGAVSASSASIHMENVLILNGTTFQNGGAVYGYQSDLTLTNSKISNCSAATKGGAIFLDGSSLFLNQSIIELSWANQGGGIYAQNTVTVQGNAGSEIWNNTATLNGGGICSSGTFGGTVLNIYNNTASVGAGIAAMSGSVNLSHVNITKNHANSDGGGVALLSTASLVLQHSPIHRNHANRNGGGVYMVSNGTFANKGASEIFNCTAASGGGFYGGEWAHPTVNAINVTTSSATLSGGCAAFFHSSALLTNAVFEHCSAPTGGGLYAGTGSNVSLLHGFIFAGTGARGGCQAGAAGGGVFIWGTQSSIQYFDVLDCSAPNGGGMFVQNVSSGTMASMTIFGNGAVYNGGGLYTQASSFEVTDIAVINNTAVVGGGVFAIDSGLSGSIRVNNNTGQRGGGFASSGNTTLEGAEISLNTAVQRGGGVAVEAGVLTLKSTRILSCSSGQGVGGGISIMSAGVQHYSLIVQNCSSTRGGGIYVNSSDFFQYPSEESTGISQYAASMADNHATDYGGSVFIAGEGAHVSDVLITNGSAPFGGGLAALDAQECISLNMDISHSNATISGGGLFYGSGVNCLLRSSQVTNNFAGESGGGLVVLDASLFHSNLDISNNIAPTGGGVHVRSDSSVSSLSWWQDRNTEKSRITANSISPDSGDAANVLLSCSIECGLSGAEISGGILLTGNGAGVFVSGDGSATISNSSITNNSAVQGGGIAVSEAQSTALENVSFVGNTASDRGGGLWAGKSDLIYFPVVNITGCAFYNNSANLRGGGISLYKVVVFSTKVLVVENHVNDSNFGSGGGLYADGQSEITADTWLMLSNDATIGGSMTGVAASQLSFLGSTFTRDVNTFFTPRWQDLFLNLVGFKYVPGLSAYDVGVQTGGIIYLSDTESVLELLSSFVTSGSADAGGGVYLDNNAFLYGENTEIRNNSATERGGSLCLSNSAQALFDSVKVIYSYCSTLGGGIYVENAAILTARSSHISNNFADDSGGGIYISIGDQNFVNLADCYVERNMAHGEGCGVYVGRGAELAGFRTQFVGNGGVTSSGKNEGGGAITTVDGDVELTNCTLADNTALVGGAIHVDRSGTAEIINSVFTGNSADEIGGAVATELEGFFNATQQTTFHNNQATLGGAVSSSGSSNTSLTSVSFVQNNGVNGGAMFITDQATLVLHSGDFSSNTAVLGGAIHSDQQSYVYISDSIFVENAASLRGGALYYESIENTSTTRITCNSNAAPSGGLYDIATNTRDVRLMWWPENVTSGVAVLEPPDEESIDGLDARNESLESTMYVWPRLKAIDIYGQIEVLDNETECSVSDALYSEHTERLKFTPSNPIRAAIGVLSYRDASFTAANRTLEEGIYTTNITCNGKSLWKQETLALSSSVNNVSCANGYGLAICSVCADGYKRAQDNSCLPCAKANAKVRSSIQWQNFVMPVMIVIGVAGGLYGMRVYLGDRTEIGLLAKAEADRRFKPHRPKNRRQPKAKVAIADRVNAKITGFLQKIQKRNSKVLFGVEVNPPAPMFPVSPSKFKILIGFFQIFGNFQSSFVVKWSANIQNFMSFSQKFNLDLVAIANIDCVVAKTFYFNFMVTVSQVVAVLTVITAYFYAGMRSYRAKLHLIPRNCLRCGLPVFESEIVHNDDESFNPLLLLRSWWRTHNFYKRAVSATAGEDDAKENDNSAAFSVIKETRLLKRKFGMSQVRTPYLGLFRSVHSKCPVKGHVLSGVMLERTIRSNLRVWQARVKLRMNYLTYRNKCLKLYCWIALFLYPSVSKSILAIYNCQQVGETYYLVADRRLVCYNGQWAVFGIIATVGVVVWVVGIPFFFGLLIWLAQDRAIAARLKVLNKLPQMRVQREKWLKAVEQQQIADNRFVRNMEDTEVQNEELAKYMKRKNLTDSTVQARLGFIYAEFARNTFAAADSIEYWWFEVVDLSRKLFLSGVIIFVENGSVEQVLLAIAVCASQPGDDVVSAVFPAVRRLLRQPHGQCVTAAALLHLVAWRHDQPQQPQRRVADQRGPAERRPDRHVRRRHDVRLGADCRGRPHRVPANANRDCGRAQGATATGGSEAFSFTDLSAPAVLEAARRVRRIEEGEDPDAVAALANIQEGEEEASA